MTRKFSNRIKSVYKETISVDMVPLSRGQNKRNSHPKLDYQLDIAEDLKQLHKRGKTRYSPEDADDQVLVSRHQSQENNSSRPHPYITHQRSLSPIELSKQDVVGIQTRAPERETRNPFDDPNMNPSSISQNTYIPQSKPRSHILYDEQDDKVSHSNKYLSLANKRTKKSMECQISSSKRMNSEIIEDDLHPLYSVYPARANDDSLPALDSEKTYYADRRHDDYEVDPREYEATASVVSYLPNDACSKNISSPEVLADSNATTTISRSTSRKNTQLDEKTVDQFEPDSTQYRGGLLSSVIEYHSKLTETPLQTLGPTNSLPVQTTGLLDIKSSVKSRVNDIPSSEAIPSTNESPSNLGISKKIIGSCKGSFRGMGSRLNSTTLIDSAKSKLSGRPRPEDEIRITIHIAETLSRQNYLLKLCRALMLFGAPTHRLEEYMRMSARVLEIQGSFLYIPGCMIISFDDANSHTTEVKLVKTVQGVNLGLLKDVHEIYKEVVHDVISVDEATQRLCKLSNSSPKYHAWVLVIVHGLASASVGPFAFQARYIDLPICFILGCILGFLQLIIAPMSDLYSNVFEISAAVLTSFLARAFGSIHDGKLFCFSALAQSSIALILPGYIVLCGSLELQSRSMVAGSVRIVYAIIYSLFLGFGISIGTTIYGLLDMNATNAITCAGPSMSDYEKWPWVVVFTLCLCVINQAKWKQTPVMLLIGFAGYIANFFSAKRFPSSAQVSNTLGAFAVGMLGNLYSRMRHGVAAAALLPAIFVQVPSGLAASGSLLAGLSTAERITNSTADPNRPVNINGISSVAVTSPEALNVIVFNVGYSMIQIAIGITVGLFMSALLIYPFGKRRSGLFTF